MFYKSGWSKGLRGVRAEDSGLRVPGLGLEGFRASKACDGFYSGLAKTFGVSWSQAGSQHFPRGSEYPDSQVLGPEMEPTGSVVPFMMGRLFYAYLGHLDA